MIRLFTEKELSPSSADAIYKICLALEDYGVTDDQVKSFETLDELLDEVVYGLEAGDEIIVGAQPSDYNSVKRELIMKLILDDYSCPAIAEAIAKESGQEPNSFDMQAHCTIPVDSVYHLTHDGLYSGFSSFVLNGRVTLLPLDFSRVDDALDSYINRCLNAESKSDDQTEQNGLQNIDDGNSYLFTESVSKMVYSLIQMDKRLSIATGEAAMWIYNLYDKIGGLSQAINFVEIIDPEKEEEEPDENGNPPEHESEAAKTIRHARESRYNMETDFGAAISDVFCDENEDGTVDYYAYVAVADEDTAKAKRINTSNPDDAKMLLPHCVTVLAETMCQKIAAVNTDLSLTNDDDDEDKKEKEDKKFSKGMIIFAAVILIFAVVSPILIVKMFFGSDSSQTTTLPPIVTGESVTSAPLSESATSGSSEQETSGASPNVSLADPFGLNFTQGSSQSQALTDELGQSVTVDNSLLPAEPAASDVSVLATAPAVASTKGTFTFFVYGYGHGVGLSQNGANYLAKQGWTYAQILANYYYGTTLVSGDTYPERITYNGQQYSTRDLLACALEGEMGPSFHEQALKAQAVAIYTFAKYYSFIGLDSNSFAYKYPASQACYNVVDDVMKNGLYIAYNGKTAMTPFHSISAGKTTSYYNVWGNTALPYLSGGRPSYGDYNAENFKTTYSISSDEFKTLVESKSDLGITLSGDPATWISVISHDTAINQDVGYVSSIKVGGKIMTGNDFRSKILDGKIRSHCFVVVYTPQG